MTEEINDNEVETPAEPAFDAASFKNDILEANRSLIQESQQTLMNQVSSMLNENKAPAPAAPSASSGLEHFADQLGLDEDQASALTSIVKEVLNEQAGQFKKEIKTEFDETLSNKEKQAQYNQRLQSEYPDITNPGSPLFRKAKEIYNGFDENIKSSSQASYLAAKQAAADLGIKPLSLSDLRRQSAQTEMGSSGTTKSTTIKPAALEAAEAFGVDKDKFAEALKARLSR